MHRDILRAELARAYVQDQQRAERMAWCAVHRYRASVRLMADAVEVFVRDVEADRVRRSVDALPVHLALPRERTEEEQAERDEENRRRSERRAAQAVRWGCKALRADHMLTLTTRESVPDVTAFGKLFNRFVGLYRARYDGWKYLAVPELQDRGALHVHVACRGRVDVHWARYCWYRALGHRARIDYGVEGKKRVVAYVREGRGWREASSGEIEGQIDIKGPSRRFGSGGESWRTDKLAGYIGKYLSKGFLGGGRKRYWIAQGVAKPEKSLIWLDAVDFVSAVREAHDLVRGRYACTELHIWHSDDLSRMWFAGASQECPF